MDVFCEICDKRWDARDPSVRYIFGDGRWECHDEAACFERRQQRVAPDQTFTQQQIMMLNWAFSQMPPARPVR